MSLVLMYNIENNKKIKKGYYNVFALFCDYTVKLIMTTAKYCNTVSLFSFLNDHFQFTGYSAWLNSDWYILQGVASLPQEFASINYLPLLNEDLDIPWVDWNLYCCIFP